MGGAFYFLSIDLAEYITGPECPRSKLFLPHEDMATGNYVFSHPKNITLFAAKKGYMHIWRHPVKNPNRLFHQYRLHLKSLAKTGIISKEKIDIFWSKTVTTL
jgi:hypothetical protein